VKGNGTADTMTRSSCFHGRGVESCEYTTADTRHQSIDHETVLIAELSSLASSRFKSEEPVVYEVEQLAASS
jgi:hypothetical protein